MSNYNTQLQSNNTDLQAILNTINELPEAGSGAQATPEISVNSTNGLITATAGTKSSTYQLAFQPAKTITPKTTDQVAVSSGYYTGGVIKVKGDANLVAGNIKSGVSIFGVSGTLESGGSGEQVEWSANEDAMVTGVLSSYFNDRVEKLCSYAFYGRTSLVTVSFPVCTTINKMAFNNCSRLTTVSFPACTTISGHAFHYCTSLVTVSFPVCATIGSYAFEGCSRLTTVSFPACTTISSYAFTGCRGLVTVSFPACTTIGSYAFQSCYMLQSLYLTGSLLCNLSNSNAFNSAPFGGYSYYAETYGSIYVPASLLTQYQTATNWAYFSSRFVGI